MRYSSRCGRRLARLSHGALGALLVYGVLLPVHFAVEIPQAKEVMLVGRFNGGWDAPRPLTTREGGGWHIRLRLPPGTYEYFYLVDSQPWVDPRAPRVEDGLGGHNNIVSLTGGGW